jgi:hypothetical protein
VNWESHRKTSGVRWETIVASLAAALALVAIAFAAVIAVPQIIANLSSEASDGRTPFVLDATDRTADIVVPAGWIVVRESAATISVRSPDGVMRAHLDLVAESPAAIVDSRSDLAGSPVTEILASGLQATHADLRDGGLVAGVSTSASGDAVRVVVEFVPAPDQDVDVVAYRPAIASLLEGVRT